MEPEQILTSAAAHRVFADLSSTSKRPIRFEPLERFASDFPNDPPPRANIVALHKPTKDEHLIYVRRDCPQDTVVHELLHALVDELGYPVPDVSIKASELTKRMAVRLKQAIDHREIFRRMTEVYGIDLTEFFANRVRARMRYIQELRKARCHPDDPQRLDDMFFLLDAFCYGSGGQQLLTAYRGVCPKTAEAAITLLDQLQQIGSDTPQRALESGRAIVAAVNSYAAQQRIRAEEVEFWKNIQIILPAAQANQ